jgi:hypothetical protein
VEILSEIKEPIELGLGYASGSKRGSALGPTLIKSVTSTFRNVPQLADEGLNHLEVLGLMVPKIAEDRLSDVTASVIKRWLSRFSRDRCQQMGLPTRKFRSMAWDPDRLDWRPFDAYLPYNPLDESPILLAPLSLLRKLPWINYDDYYKNAYSRLILPSDHRGRAVAKEAVLAYNRANYEVVRQYVESREREALHCSPSPLFMPLQIDTLKRKISQIRALPRGRTDGADKKFEDLAFGVLSSLLYPELDLADSQVRTISGAHIRDIIFHNDAKTPFLGDLREQYGARQIVFELKNVSSLDTEHVNQLYRYLDGEEIGRFGVLFARNRPGRNVLKNCVDLHSSKRAAIICMDDTDLELMVQLAESGRRPVDALRKKHVEFTRMLPK